MPCYDSRSEPEYILAEAQKEWRHNSPVAEMLCRVCKNIEYNGWESATMDKEVMVWWREHKERDAAKEAKE